MVKHLYAPWRSSYSKSVSKRDSSTKVSSRDCIFCGYLADKDAYEKNLVFKPFNHHFIIMNRYPYNAGHLLILSQRHCEQLYDLSSQEHLELMQLTSACTKIFEQILDCHGINIGINLGRAAGAGIPSHLHVHVLPRWQGDTNFLPLLADTKPISFDLHQIYATLKPSIEAIQLT